jgi:hypothetical protein
LSLRLLLLVPPQGLADPEPQVNWCCQLRCHLNPGQDCWASQPVAQQVVDVIRTRNTKQRAGELCLSCGPTFATTRRVANNEGRAAATLHTVPVVRCAASSTVATQSRGAEQAALLRNQIDFLCSCRIIAMHEILVSPTACAELLKCSLILDEMTAKLTWFEVINYLI